jgi:hypothetical protein
MSDPPMRIGIDPEPDLWDELSLGNFLARSRTIVVLIDDLMR